MVFAAEPFLEIDRLILVKISMLLIENFIYFHINVLKHDKTGIAEQGYFFIFCLKVDNT